MPLIEPGAAFKGIQLGQGRRGNGVQLAVNAALTGDGHRKGAQVVEAGAGQGGGPQPARPLETAVVGLAPLQGAIDKQGDLHRRRCLPFVPKLLIMMAISPQPMTIALLVALAGSLALMAFIVKRLERA